ncbi:hypothetical protein ShzoTeo12_04190 [Shinella zoogloeoides]|nr:hypothetical protein ShzoTeo12_04190 [Shinella zoogloeoides]
MGGDGEAQADAEQKDETDEFHSRAFQQIVAGALECSCRTVVALNQTDENSSRPSVPDGESPSPAPMRHGGAHGHCFAHSRNSALAFSGQSFTGAGKTAIFPPSGFQAA